MILKWIKNKIHLYIKKMLAKRSFIDSSAIIQSNVKIIESELYGNVSINKNSVIYRSLISGDITIGRNTTLWGPDIQVLSINYPIKIGSFCSIARSVTIQEYFHNYNRLTTYFIGRNVFGYDIKSEVLSKGSIEIGNDVWIGTGVQIMSGITIGDGAVIAANSTVTHNVPPYAIVAGVPAKTIKFRFSQEIIEKLLQIKWWNWTTEKIKKNKELFSLDLSLEKLKEYE